MSGRVHWSTPRTHAGYGTDQLWVDEGCEEDIECVSGHTSDFSTNATQSDLAGPGRIVGRAYRRAGRALEDGLLKIAKKARPTRRQDVGQGAEQAHGALVQFQEDNRGGRNRRRQGTSAAGTSETGSSMWHTFTFRTLSSDETATNLPGAGRLLGNLYTVGGRLLESRMNKIAIKSGRGPDACAERIRKAVIGEPYLEEDLMKIQVKIRDRWKAKNLSDHDRLLFPECRLLLRYAL